jgi:hypothetical protein
VAISDFVLLLSGSRDCFATLAMTLHRHPQRISGTATITIRHRGMCRPTLEMSVPSLIYRGPISPAVSRDCRRVCGPLGVELISAVSASP